MPTITIPDELAPRSEAAGEVLNRFTLAALDIIASLQGRRLFQTPEEVDRHLQEERDSWDR